MAVVGGSAGRGGMGCAASVAVVVVVAVPALALSTGVLLRSAGRPTGRGGGGPAGGPVGGPLSGADSLEESEGKRSSLELLSGLAFAAAALAPRRLVVFGGMSHTQSRASLPGDPASLGSADSEGQCTGVSAVLMPICTTIQGCTAQRKGEGCRQSGC